MDSKWQWKVSTYYGPKAKPPRVPGTLAIETVHTDEASRDVEILAGRNREDIGDIQVEDLRKNG